MRLILALLLTLSLSCGATQVQHRRLHFRSSGPYTQVLMHFDGADGSTTMTDEVGHAFSVAGTAALDTDQKKIGSASLYLQAADGNHIIADATSADFNLGSTFTAEFYVRSNNFSVSTETRRIWAMVKSVDANNTWDLFLYHANTDLSGQWDIRVRDVVGGGVALSAYTAKLAFADGTWYHIALTRSGATWNMTVDGVDKALTFAVGTTAYAFDASLGKLEIGERDEVGDECEVWFDELRISNVARYTSFPFTPPAAAFTKD